MDSLNTIPNSGSFGDVSAKLNDNFSKVGQSLTTLENVAIANKGYFDTLASLQAAFPSPKAGNIAYVANVASSTGYYIYNVVSGVWTATSTEAPAVDVAISNYAQHGYSSSPKTLKQVDDEVVQLAGDISSTLLIQRVFTESSRFTNIDTQGILSVKASYDWRHITDRPLFLWWLTNGSGVAVNRTVYIATKNTDGTIAAGNVVAGFNSDNTVITDIEEITLTQRNNSGVEIKMLIDWAKVKAKNTSYLSTDTELNIPELMKNFTLNDEMYVEHKFIPDVPARSIISASGKYYSPVFLLKNDLSWNSDTVWEGGVLKTDNRFITSVPVGVTPGMEIACAKIPSQSYNHVFLDDEDNVIQLFGTGAVTWYSELGVYVVPSGATKVSFTWHGTSTYWDFFKTDINFSTAKSAPAWTDDFAWVVGQWDKVSTSGLSVTEKIHTDSIFVKVKAQTSDTIGAMCFDEHGAPLGVVPCSSTAVGDIAEVRLLNKTKYVSFSYVTGSKATFSYQFVRGVLFTVSADGMSIATRLQGTGFNVETVVAVMKNALSGKRGKSFGDSITWYDGKPFSNTHKEEGIIAKGYQSYMREQLNCEIINRGEGGWDMTQILTRVLSDDYAGIQFVTLTSGANDARKGVPVGVISPIGGTFNTSTYAGAMQRAIEHILSVNLNMIIILLTPIKGWFNENGTSDVPGDYPDIPESYPNIIKELGRLYSLPVIDLYDKSGINKVTRQVYIGDKDFLPGGEIPIPYYLHPTNSGFEKMGRLVCSSIVSML